MTFYFLCIYILDIDPLYRSIVKLSEDNFSKLEISFNDQKAYFAPARISLDQRVAFIHLILSVHWIFERSYWTVSLNQTWDEELATIAQRWADQCNFDHDCNDCRRVGKCNFQSKVICYHLIIIAIHLEPSWFWLIDNLLDYGPNFEGAAADRYDYNKGAAYIDSFTNGLPSPDISVSNWVPSLCWVHLYFIL